MKNKSKIPKRKPTVVARYADLKAALALLDTTSLGMRKFKSGATRNPDEGKHDFEGFLSPLVIERFGQYMTKHRTQSDGKLRESDNWQKGIPLEQYMKSGFRHFMDWWMGHRGHFSREGLEDALMGLLFNVMGYTHEVLLGERWNEETMDKE